MKTGDRTRERDFSALVSEIKASDRSDAQKLAQAFDHITGSIIETAGREIEVARAMQDRESLVKLQIKMQSFKSARGIFQDCYTAVLGGRAWDERENE